MYLDFANITPSLLNWMIVGLMSVTFITFWKFFLNKVGVPGLSDLFASI